MLISMYEVEIDRLHCKKITEDVDFLLEPKYTVHKRLTAADFVTAVATSERNCYRCGLTHR